MGEPKFKKRDPEKIQEVWADALNFFTGVDLDPDKTEHSIKCLLHKEENPSMGINLAKGVWLCRAGCGQGTLRNLLEKVSGKSFLEIDSYVELLKDRLGITIGFKIEGTVADDSVSSLPLIDFPFDRTKVPAWIFERGFSKKILKEWGCGYAPGGSLAIPISDREKRNVGWLLRQPKGIEPRYIYSKNLRKSELLFGLHGINSPEFLCITEGSLDTIWLSQFGYSSVAILGSQISKHQIDLLLLTNPKEIVLCLDRDKAGFTGRDLLWSYLKNEFPLTTINLPENTKDVQDIRDENTLRTIIKNRSLFIERE